jgi:hypothetical protein
MARRRPPTEVRVASVGLFAIGGVLVVLSLMAVGVLLSNMEVDPVSQHGTGYLDFLLFFNGVVCLLPLTALVIVLGLRLLRGDHWAWLTTLILSGLVLVVAPLAVVVLQAPVLFAIVPVGCSVAFGFLLLRRAARDWAASS